MERKKLMDIVSRVYGYGFDESGFMDAVEVYNSLTRLDRAALTLDLTPKGKEPSPSQIRWGTVGEDNKALL